MAEFFRAENLSAGYGEARIISNFSLTLEDGKSLALLGRNGVGKTTLINSLIGVTTAPRGAVVLAGVEMTMLPPHRRARAGIGWTPQERNIFRSLTVEENLSAIATPGPWGCEECTKCFRGSASAGATWAGRFQAASSRCSRSAAHWC